MYHQLQHSQIVGSAHNAFMCFAWISQQTAVISQYSIKLFVFISEVEIVFCEVWTGSSNQTNFLHWTVNVMSIVPAAACLVIFGALETIYMQCCGVGRHNHYQTVSPPGSTKVWIKSCRLCDSELYRAVYSTVWLCCGKDKIHAACLLATAAASINVPKMWYTSCTQTNYLCSYLMIYLLGQWTAVGFLDQIQDWC
jgi:hypothetical protein